MQKSELTEQKGKRFSGPTALMADRRRVTRDERKEILCSIRSRVPSCFREDLRETFKRAANVAEQIDREARRGWYWGGNKYYMPWEPKWVVTWSVNPVCRDRISSVDPEVHIVWYTHPKYDSGGLPLKMGLCSFNNYLGYKKRYWWDVRPAPDWWDPEDGVRDPSQGANFDLEA